MQQAPTKPKDTARSHKDRAVSSLRETVKGRAIPTVALALVVLLATWMGGAAAGGYYAGGWTPIALFIAALLCIVSVLGRAERPGGMHAGILALALLAAYAGWTLLSILWSPNAGEAWTGSGRTLLYLLGFLISLMLVGLSASRRWVLLASVLGPAAVAAFTLLVPGSEIGELFEDNRLVGSVGYFNAEAAFLMLPFWVAMYLGGSRRLNPVLRGLVLGGAVLSTSVAILPQSRGAVAAMAVSTIVFFLFSGRRLRGLISLVPVAGAIFLAFPELNGVYQTAAGGGSIEAAIGDASPAVWLGTAVAVLYGLAWGLIDRWWRPSRWLVNLAGAAAAACLVGAVFAGAVLFNAQVGSPAGFAQEKWGEFKGNVPAEQEQSRYLSASNNNRIPQWEVAWQDAKAHPVLGVGTRNWEATYYQLREENAGTVRQPHSLPLEILAERGFVGGILFFGFLAVCAGRGLWCRFRKLRADGKAQVGALLAAVTYWFVHSSVEWFWQIPAVTLVAFVYLALLAGPWRGESREAAAGAKALRLGSIGVAVLAFLVVAPLFASNVYLQKSHSAQDSESALAAIERAQTFNPLDSRLARREAEIAMEAGDWDRVEASYREAMRLDPEHYGPRLLMASYHEKRGNFEEALLWYERARELNLLDTQLEQKVQQLESFRA